MNFWGYYGGAVVTADNAVLGDLSLEVWGPANHPIYSRWHLPKSRLLAGRIAIGVTGGKRELLSLAARLGAESSFAQTRSPNFLQLRRALVSEVLRHRNFEIVEAENLSWREQANLFAGASVIVAPLANIVFCKPGTRVVEISTRAGYRDWYWQLAAVAGLSYEVMEAQRSGSFSGPYENADMIVSRENFERLLESL